MAKERWRGGGDKAAGKRRRRWVGDGVRGETYVGHGESHRRIDVV